MGGLASTNRLEIKSIGPWWWSSSRYRVCRAFRLEAVEHAHYSVGYFAVGSREIWQPKSWKEKLLVVKLGQVKCRANKEMEMHANSSPCNYRACRDSQRGVGVLRFGTRTSRTNLNWAKISVRGMFAGWALR
jgi:hypothetical protein